MLRLKNLEEKENKCQEITESQEAGTGEMFASTCTSSWRKRRKQSFVERKCKIEKESAWVGGGTNKPKQKEA